MNKKTNKISKLIITDSSRIEETKEILLSWLRDNKNIKKIELQQELVETTPPEALWKEFKPGKRKLIISE